MTGLVSLASATMLFAHLNAPAPVQIAGAIKNPGPVYVQESASIRSVVKLAGGFAANADLRAIEVQTPSGEKRKWDLYALGVAHSVRPGDIVTVPTLDPKTVVFVEGPVTNRAPIEFKQGLTLAEVLATAKPTNPKEMNRVVVSRANPGVADSKTTYKVSELALIAPTVVLMPGDKVSVPYASVETSDRQLLTIVVVVLLVILLVK